MIMTLGYGTKNLHNVENALQHISCTCCVMDKKEDLQRTDQLILPGVGALADYMKHPQECDLTTASRGEVQGKKEPLLGICLGMQTLSKNSEEDGYTKRLGFLKNSIMKMNDATEGRLRIPHIGWDLLEQCQEPSVLERLNECPFVHCVYSYHVQNYAQEDSLADSGYGRVWISGLVRRDNIVGTRLHSEKNGEDGLQVLRWFKEEFI